MVCARILNVWQRREASEMGKMMRWDVIKILITWNWSCRCRRRHRRRHHHRELCTAIDSSTAIRISGRDRKKTRRISHSRTFYSIIRHSPIPVSQTEMIYISFFSFCSACDFSTEKIVVFALSPLCDIQFSNFNKNYASRTANENCNALENEIEERQCCCPTLELEQATDAGRPPPKFSNKKEKLSGIYYCVLYAIHFRIKWCCHPAVRIRHFWPSVGNDSLVRFILSILLDIIDHLLEWEKWLQCRCRCSLCVACVRVNEWRTARRWPRIYAVSRKCAWAVKHLST